MSNDDQNSILEQARSAQQARMTWWGLTVACLALGGVAMLLPYDGASAGAAVDSSSDGAARASLLSPTQTQINAGGSTAPSFVPTPTAPGVSQSAANVPATSGLFAIPTNSFNGRKLIAARTIQMEVTAYSPDERSCGKSADGITASGMSVWTNGMKLVAADTTVLPMKSVISVPGYNLGKPVPVLDRGGAIKGNRLDVLFPTHEAARKWGRQKLNVVVWEYVD